MNSPKAVSFLAGAIAIASLVNWITGDRSVLGRRLFLREEPRWAAARWFGLGVWISTIVATSSDDHRPALAGLVGALVLAFGTARKAAKGGRANRGGPTADKSQHPTG